VRRGGRCGRFDSRAGRAKWAERVMRLDTHTGVVSISRLTEHISRDISIPRVVSAPNILQSFSKDVEAAVDSHECLMVGDACGIMDIPMKDIVECEALGGTAYGVKFREHMIRPRSMSGLWNSATGFKVAESTLEVQAKTKREQQLCVAVLAGRPILAEEPDAHDFAELVEEHRQAVDALDPSRRTCTQHLLSIVTWFCFPVMLALEISVPKCFSPSTRKWWPLTFLMSMVWLAFFSYWICVMADVVSWEFGIPSSLLGLTLTAIGTSFPNCVASVIVARQGKCSMAIANALGSNIQNVFLALGIPWFFCALAHDGHFPQDTAGITAGVVSMAGSLALFVVFISIGRSSLGRVSAVSFLMGYLMFFVFTILAAYGFV